MKRSLLTCRGIDPLRLSGTQAASFTSTFKLQGLSSYIARHYYFVPGRGVKYCDQRTCLYVCLFVRQPARRSQKVPVRISPNLLHMLTVAVARSSSDGNAIRYVLPVLWVTSRFHIIKRIGENQSETYASSSSPGGGTASEVCRL